MKSAIAQTWEQASSLMLYTSVLQEKPGQAFVYLLQALYDCARHVSDDLTDCLPAYGRWFRAMAEQNQTWSDYILTQILRSENPFSHPVQQQGLDRVPAALKAAAQADLEILRSLAACDGHQLSRWVAEVSQVSPPIAWETETQPHLAELHSQIMSSGANALRILADYYQQHGTGLFADYHAYRWQGGELVGIAYPDPIQVSSLVGYEAQKAALIQNTEFLLQGYPALHILLYGSRGTGKSSLIKGLLNRYGERGLRLIEVSKADLRDLPTIVDPLRHQPQRFIIFVDDLSFEEDDDAYKALKVVLEGNLTARPANVVVYATSNRRHLVREFFADRPRPVDADEIHHWDTVQEKLSFSDRFGLTLTFEPADQSTYLDIIHHLAAEAGLTLAPEDLNHRALQWATRHNGRSGRTARQCIDFLKAEHQTGI